MMNLLPCGDYEILLLNLVGGDNYVLTASSFMG
jgi:hypothetical protein